jgi:hypothetical protein
MRIGQGSDGSEIFLVLNMVVLWVIQFIYTYIYTYGWWFGTFGEFSIQKEIVLPTDLCELSIGYSGRRYKFFL